MPARALPAMMVVLVLVLGVAPSPQAQSTPAIQLVVVLTVDQFRPDYLSRFGEEYTAGLQRLLGQGAVFTNAFLEHYPSVTAIGHATVLSGATPSISGIIGNDWFDRAEGKSVQSITDEAVSVLGTAGAGASPNRLLVSTIGDELKLAAVTRDPAHMPKVIGVSAKDRGAILPAGRGADGAYWLPRSAGPFASSTYYFDTLPAWVATLNALPVEPPGEGASPTNRRVLAFAREAIVAERLGQRGVTDLLAIGLSDNDTIGHTFGPDSPEVRQVSIETDRLLGEFFAALDREVGLARILVILTADHGVAPLPERQVERRMAGGRIDANDLFGPIRAALEAQFGPGDWLLATAGTSPYLNHALIAERGLSQADVRRVAAEAAMQAPHVARVYTRDQLLLGQVAPDLVGRRVLRGFNAQRSGDLEIILEPNWLRGRGGTTHGTAYNYDAHIPLIFMGPGIAPGRYHQQAALNDVAPTLATLLDVAIPTGADGRVLAEMFDPATDGHATR